jgi:hypothetical protein
MSRKGLIISITVLFLQNQKQNKTEITLKMLNDFEEGFENNIQSWMDTIEGDLSLLKIPMICVFINNPLL